MFIFLEYSGDWHISRELQMLLHEVAKHSDRGGDTLATETVTRLTHLILVLRFI